jgi:hypothetical protein
MCVVVVGVGGGGHAKYALRLWFGAVVEGLDTEWLFSVSCTL